MGNKTSRANDKPTNVPSRAVLDIDSKKPLIIGLSGKIGVGKDYIARYIFTHFLVHKKNMFISFADRLKAECAARHNISYERLYVKKDAESRKCLQDVGDDLREKYGETYFSNWMAMQIRHHSEVNNVKIFIITDVRFPEEVELIQDMDGYVFRVEAPIRNNVKLISEYGNNEEAIEQCKRHRSETLLDDYKDFDMFINNDPKDDYMKDCKDAIMMTGYQSWDNDEQYKSSYLEMMKIISNLLDITNTPRLDK